MMPRMKKESRVLGPLLKKLGREIGARVILEPRWGVVGRITFKNGRHSYFRYNTLDLNPVGSSDIAKDKDYAAFFLKKLGYPVPVGRAFVRPAWGKTIGSNERTDTARRYAKRLGFPLIVKPNSGSQGFGVQVVHSIEELDAALLQVFAHDRIALVQKPVPGRDYRIVVLDGRVISAYERTPLSVVGNGRASIRRLLNDKQAMFDISNRDTCINADDPRIALKLKKQKLTMRSIPAAGARIFLLDNANLSTGGDSLDVTERMHPRFAKIAADITKGMGLRLCGVDVMTDDISKFPKKYAVLEINAAPGLDHYVTSGAKQREIVADLYRRILKALER